MFSKIKRLLGNITVNVKKNAIYVGGIPADVIAKDIKRIWGNRVLNNLFNKIDNNSFSFDEYFAVDIVYAIDTLLSEKGMGASKHTLSKIKALLLEHTWLANLKKEYPSKLNYHKLENFHFTPLPEQSRFFTAYDQITQQFGLNGLLLAAAAGGGKEQPLDASIKIPGGWTTMGEIKLGQLVTAKDGTATKVTGIFPQGKKEIFKITFSDGRTAECGKEHLWTIMRPLGKDGMHRETVNLEQIMNYMEMPAIKDRIHIDLIDSEQSPDLELKIDPYLLGVILGDGSCSDGSLTVTTPDQFIVDEITSWEKHIPEVYLHASTEQRLSLLQGLMDTDGTIDTKSTCSYSSTSYTLAMGVVYLIRSLGGIASISLRNPSYTHKGEKLKGRIAYQVNIRFKKPSDLFRLPKKKERANDDGQYCKNLRLRIEKIESVGFKEAQCILVEHPEHLYVTDSFVVTHNSIGSMMLVECLEVDQVIVVSPKNAVNRVWETTIKTGMKTIPTNWIVGSGKEFKGNENYIVFNYEYLTKFIEQSGKLSGKKIAVILDESHNFNTHDSLRTLAFIEMCKKIKAAEVVWLSGTPIKALATEAIPLFRAIDPKFTEDVEARFKKIFGVSSERGTDILKNRLGYALFIVEKKEQNLQEPEFREIKVKIPNSEIYTLEAISKQMYDFTQERLAYYKSRAKEDNDFFNKCLDSHQRTLRTANDLTQFEFYKRCLKIVIKSGGDVRMAKEEIIYCNKYEHTKILPTLAKEVKADFKNVKSIIKYVKLKIMGECLGRIVGGARIACNVELCKYVDYVAILENSPKKTIVFTSFVEVVETLQPHLENLGLESLFVYAKTNNKLAAIVERFEKDEDANPLVATFASLSTAVPLIMADQMVMLNQPYRSYMVEQTVARINRIGATTQAKVFNVVLDTDNIPNISSRSFDIARWSAQQVQAITGVVSSIDFSEDMEQSNLALEGLLPEEPNDAQAMPSYLSW